MACRRPRAAHSRRALLPRVRPRQHGRDGGTARRTFAREIRSAKRGLLRPLRSARFAALHRVRHQRRHGATFEREARVRTKPRARQDVSRISVRAHRPPRRSRRSSNGLARALALARCAFGAHRSARATFERTGRRRLNTSRVLPEESHPRLQFDVPGNPDTLTSRRLQASA